MARLHDPQISKIQNIVGYTLSILASAMILFSGISKVLQTEMMVANMGLIPNFGPRIVFIGLLELSILALYWIPKTSNLGFFLMASYGGGIIVAETVLGGNPVIGLVVTSFFYLGTLLRKPSLLGWNK